MGYCFIFEIISIVLKKGGDYKKRSGWKTKAVPNSEMCFATSHSNPDSLYFCNSWKIYENIFPDRNKITPGSKPSVAAVFLSTDVVIKLSADFPGSSMSS